MCFRKSEKSKVLRAKRDIVVYKIGDKANKNNFVPYYMNIFTYKTDRKYLICPDFKSNSITVGFHGYINIIVTSFKSCQLYAIIKKNTKQKSVISMYPIFQDQDTLYLGKFIVPKGAIYCVNKSNEIVSNEMIYTGQYSSILKALDTNLKELWKEKQVKYLLIMIKPIKQYQVMGAKIVVLKT